MTSPRKVIREAIAAHLIAAGTLAADRVWASSEPPVDVESVLINEGPVVLVYTRRDHAKDNDFPASGFGAVKRTLEVVVEAIAAGSIVVDGKVDDLAEQIEAALDDFTIPGQNATELRHMETTIDSTSEFEQPVGSASILYDACYWRAWRNAPTDDEDIFFPSVVIANGDEVANCDDCEDCPDGQP